MFNFNLEDLLSTYKIELSPNKIIENMSNTDITHVIQFCLLFLFLFFMSSILYKLIQTLFFMYISAVLIKVGHSIYQDIYKNKNTNNINYFG